MKNWMLLSALACQLTIAAPPPVHSNRNVVPNKTPIKKDAGRPLGRELKERSEAKTHVITSPINVEIKEGCLDKDEGRKSLLTRLNEGKDVPFNELTDQFISLQQKQSQGESKLSEDKLSQILKSIRTGVSRVDLHQMKVDYEKLLTLKNKKPITYNAQSKTVEEVCRLNSLNCYSGTALNQIIARKVLSRDTFNQQNPVIVYEAGHILPGYLVKEESGDYHLYGIETTAEGPAKIDFGLAKDLNHRLNIVDANDWLVTELFQDCIDQTNLEGMAALMIDKTAKKYGIDREKTDPKSAAVEGSSPFAFGEPKATEGNLERNHIDSVKRSDISGENTRSTIQDIQKQIEGFIEKQAQPEPQPQPAPEKTVTEPEKKPETVEPRPESPALPETVEPKPASETPPAPPQSERKEDEPASASEPVNVQP